MNGSACPKTMRHGPCGGVGDHGGCEVDGRPCPFIGPGATYPPGPHHPPVPLRWREPVVLVDVRAPSRWAGDARALWRRTARAVAGCIALIGDHADNPPDHEDSGRLAPETVVDLLRQDGVATIVTVTGRDHDQEAVRRIVGRVQAAGALAVHCVTGDHPAAVGLDRPAWFGTESIRMLVEPAAAGLAATAAESPAAPGDRVARLLAKQRAGASACILNHSGRPDALMSFVDRCRTAGVTLPMIAPVPMVADARAAARLAAFPGLRLPDGYLADIMAAAAPAERAIEAAAGLAATLMGSGRFAGINLSGGASGTTPDERLEMTRAFITATRTALGPSTQR